MEGYVYLLRCADSSVFDAGTGWEEDWLPPDPEMDRPQEEVVLTRCAWAGQWMVYPDGDMSMLPTAEVYNRAHTGRRIWIGDRFPTAAERAAAPWMDGEGALVWAPLTPGEPPTATATASAAPACREDYCEIRLE